MFLKVVVLLLIISYEKVRCDPSPLTCNGDISLCDQRYNNITYLVTHDSYAHGINLASTQTESILHQLGDGVRGLKLSAVLKAGQVHLCHTSCALLDAGSASDTLSAIAKWLTEHPNEVVTIMWNNLYNIDIVHIAASYKKSAAMPFVYTYTEDIQQNNWPTLGELIKSGKRLINFVDTMANITVAPWLLPQYDAIFETPYDNTEITGFQCVIDRPRTLARDQSSMMYVMNHFLYGVVEVGAKKIEVPQIDKASITNGKALQDHVDDCIRAFGRKPNFIEVDFYNHGNTLQVVAMLNNIAIIPAVAASPHFSIPTSLPNIDDIKSVVLSVPTSNIIHHSDAITPNAMSSFVLSLYLTSTLVLLLGSTL
ncbi:PLC-like phosphodiesterase [Dichotomocladium elegans]|nr:PLC-like phosphodiesterase [Dichotomocladium elegans]